MEEYARIPVEVEYASEFRYRNPIITRDDIVIAISQSGETADTLAALNLAKEKGATQIVDDLPWIVNPQTVPGNLKAIFKEYFKTQGVQTT